MPPKVNAFANSFESQANAADIDARIDDSLRSYMDSGEDLFENEDVDGKGTTRRDVIGAVRVNILRRLAEENAASRRDADKMKDDHNAYSADMIGDFSAMQRAVLDRLAAEHEMQVLDERMQHEGGLTRFFKFRGVSKARIRSRIRSLEQSKDSKARKIREKVGKWAVIRADYGKNVARKHYKTYDALAKSWYELTHERAVSQLPENASEDDKRAAMAERAIPEQYAKNIIEYTGVYLPNGVEALIRAAQDAPGTMIQAGELPKIAYKVSNNAIAEDDYLTKSHKKILMLSEADASTGIQTRYKFDINFLGNKAKSQFTAADSEETAVFEGPQMPVYAENAGLESDRKDINGRFLFSEKSAEILHARLKRNGKTVYGFYQNGEFLTNDDEGETLEDGTTRVSGKKDMQFFGRRNWNKQEKAEKLRVAIRTSPFFQHVNARTIQYYAGYNAGDDMVDEIMEAMQGRWDRAQEDDPTLQKNTVVGRLRADPEELSNLPDSLKPAALTEYLIEQAARPAVDGQNPFSYTDPSADPVLRLAIQSERKSLQLTCLALLANDTNPKLWDLGKNIVTQNPKIVDIRTRSKLKYLPKTGMMMRMGLLDELANHQGVFSETDLKEEDPLNFINIPQYKVYMEELNNRRGAGNWIKRNLLNGKLISKAFGLATTGVKAAQGSKDFAEILKDPKYKVSDATKDKRLEQEFWLSYGETMAESGNIAAILSGAGVAATWAFGGDTAMARDYGFQVFDVLDMINQAAQIVSAIKEFVKYIYRKFIKKAPRTEDEIQEEQRKQRETLKNLDLPGVRAVLKFLKTLIGFVNNARDLASYHVSSEESSQWDVVTNQKWGDLLAYKGPLDYIFTTAQNVLGIGEDLVEFYTATKRIGRIDRTDRMIESAISKFQAPPPPPAQEGEANEQQEEDPEAQQQRELGEAAVNNSQAQYFMALTKRQSRKTRSAAAWDAGTKLLNIAKDSVNQFVPTVDPFTAGLKIVLTVAPKVTEFMGWMIGKIKYDSGNFKDNIASMLGDKAYAKTPYFDKVLKRETGIVSSSYLVDIAKIFTSIDTHVLAHKENKTPGELDLAKAVVGTMYGNVNEDSIKTIKLDDMLKYAGLNGDSDWRSLLRNAITQ